MPFSRLRFAALPLSLVLVAGCGGGDHNTPADGGTDGGGCIQPLLAWADTALGATPGVTRQAPLQLSNDACTDGDIALVSSDPSVATVPATVQIPKGKSQVDVPVQAVAMGTATITATLPNPGGDARTATIDIVVTDTSVPSCDGTGGGMLAPGGEVRVTTGALAGAGIAMPSGASRDDTYHVDPLHVDVACAPDQVPDGYSALGPAVSFAPAYGRFRRELPVRIPVRMSLLPEGRNIGYVEVSYTGPGITTPRTIPVADMWVDGAPDGGMLVFRTPRLGTYQAVVRSGSPMQRMRNFQFRAITGVSMGGGGAGLIGLKHPGKFDFVAPLGGPVDWDYVLHYISTYTLGGFCTEDQRAADPTGCAAGASLAHTPPSNQLYEHVQDYEHWWNDGYPGQGSSFDRRTEIQISEDLTFDYGNLNTVRSTDPTAPNITPPGVPDSFRMRTNADRCANPIVIPPCDGTAPGSCTAGTGYFDDEYNPDGAYPVITYCDGPEVTVGGQRQIGIWDPTGTQDTPETNGLAVDINGNGVRDPGEPVIRAGHEPFDDCGVDRLCDPDEPGYDPVTNPDPNGDDYDFQFNPNGTENNWVRDGDPCDPSSGEAFLDVGLDGVMGTAQLADGGFDYGEGNGCYDLAPGAQRMEDENPRSLALGADMNALRDVDVMTDGGTRDPNNFLVDANHFAGAFSARGLPLHIYDSHAAMLFSGLSDESDFDFSHVRWDRVGKYAVIRYGNPDATVADKMAGDGGHVGTGAQIFNRLIGSLAWISARWPGGDRRRVVDQICASTTPGCAHANEISMDFTSSTGRSGPVAVVLPPGYFDPENADETYPVVYFLHGYGMQPTDLIALGTLMWTYMTARTIPEAERIQKMIFVFPDGRCRDGECHSGTFYVDAPDSTPNGAKMETFMLDLMDYVDAHFRTRSPESVPVTE